MKTRTRFIPILLCLAFALFAAGCVTSKVARDTRGELADDIKKEAGDNAEKWYDDSAGDQEELLAYKYSDIETDYINAYAAAIRIPDDAKRNTAIAKAAEAYAIAKIDLQNSAKEKRLNTAKFRDNVAAIGPAADTLNKMADREVDANKEAVREFVKYDLPLVAISAIETYLAKKPDAGELASQIEEAKKPPEQEKLQNKIEAALGALSAATPEGHTDTSNQHEHKPTPEGHTDTSDDKADDTHHHDTNN